MRYSLFVLLLFSQLAFAGKDGEYPTVPVNEPAKDPIVDHRDPLGWMGRYNPTPAPPMPEPAPVQIPPPPALPPTQGGAKAPDDFNGTVQKGIDTAKGKQKAEWESFQRQWCEGECWDNGYEKYLAKRDKEEARKKEIREKQAEDRWIKHIQSEPARQAVKEIKDRKNKEAQDRERESLTNFIRIAFGKSDYFERNNPEVKPYIISRITNWGELTVSKILATKVIERHVILADRLATEVPIKNRGSYDVAKSIFDTSVQSSLPTLVLQAELDSPDFEESYHEQMITLDVVDAFLDIAMDMVPIVGTAKAVYEGFTGKSLLDGHELTITEQGTALLAIIPSAVVSGVVAKGTIRGIARAISKLENKLGQLSRNETIANSDYTHLEIKIPYDTGFAYQDVTQEAINARAVIQNGGVIFRIGTRGINKTGPEAQFWSFENPLGAGRATYGARYGMPQANWDNANFIETATVRPGTIFVTRHAPRIGINPGGGIEVVVPEGATLGNIISPLVK